MTAPAAPEIVAVTDDPERILCQIGALSPMLDMVRAIEQSLLDSRLDLFRRGQGAGLSAARMAERAGLAGEEAVRKALRRAQ